MTKQRFAAWTVILVLAGVLIAEAQRPGVYTTLRLSDTTANALLVGCAVGSTACTGGVKSGGITTTGDMSHSYSAPIDYYKESDAAANNQNWRIGVNAEGLFIDVLNDALSTSASVMQVERTANTVDSITFAPVAFRTSGALTFSSIESQTTATGEQTITLGAGTYELRITTGGNTTEDEIIGLTGGTAGRQVLVCNVGSVAAGGPLQLASEDGDATAANRIKYISDGSNYTIEQELCVQLRYDSTSSRWRVMGMVN